MWLRDASLGHQVYAATGSVLDLLPGVKYVLAPFIRVDGTIVRDFDR